MAAEVMKSGADMCPDLETIAAYLDGTLPERDRARVAGHLAACETCYFVFTEAAQMRAAHRASDAAPVRHGAVAPWLTRRVLWSSGGLLAAAATVVLMVASGVMPWRTGDPAEFRTLVAAVGTDRLVEPRLTGGFAHGPMRLVRGGDPLASTVSPDVRIAAAELEKALDRRTSADALRARGTAAVLIGDVERGVTTLEAAAQKKPTDARIQSDLAAAYLARAASRSLTDDAAKALTAANRAINADRTLPEALFNRAFALERLGLRDDARAAWRAYLVIDAESGWADEARTHLRQLGDR